MSFRQIFNRFTSIARASTSFNDWRGRDTFDEELRRAEELIRETRLAEERKRDESARQQQQDAAPPASAPDVVIVAYRTLGVRAGSSIEEVTRAYRLLIARVHPDRFASKGPEEQERAGERAKQINEAYRIVKEHRGVR